jgi:hypothetical protein
MKKYILIVVTLIFIIYCIWFLCVNLITIDTSNYRGNGIITKVGSGFIAKGYEIEFDKQILKNKFSLHYRLEGLPKISKNYIFYLKIPNKSSTYKPNINGQYNIIVKNNEGGILLNIKSNLSDWKQTSISDKSIDLYYLKDGVSSSIDYKKVSSQIIYLDIEFIPKGISINDDIYLVLKAGGSI